MWTYSLDPVIVSLWGLQIRWYGIVYALGFLFTLWFILKSREELKISKDDAYDLVFYIMIGTVLGARIFHVLFWEPSYYFANPLEILYIWKGGLAFHGGLVGAVFGGLIYCRKKSISFFKVADILTIPGLVGLGFGRIANFINGELVGTVTNVSWCVNFGDGLCRHPYVLYSAAKRFIFVGVIYWVSKRNMYKEGFLFWLMLLFLGIGRFFLDYLREDVLYFGLSMGQWMSIGLALFAGVILFYRYRANLRNVFKE